jgi:hypothetical protein
MRSDCAYAKRTAKDAMTIEDYLTLPHAAPSQILPGYHGTIDTFLEKSEPASQRRGGIGATSACCPTCWRKPTWC